MLGSSSDSTIGRTNDVSARRADAVTMTPPAHSTKPAAPGPIRQRRSDWRTEATRTAILQAASRLFVERGYRNTTVASIAEVVGITDAGILHHYGTKEQLLRDAVESIYAAQEQRFKELTQPGGLEAIRNLSRWGHVMQEGFGPFGGLLVVLSAEVLAQDSDIHDWFATKHSEFVKRIAALMREGIRRGEIRDDVDVKSETRALLAYFLGARFLWLYMDKGFSIGSALERYVNLLVERIRSPRRGRRTVRST